MPREKRARLNDEIAVPIVRLIDQDGQQLGIVPIAEALAKAESIQLDLVEISPDAEPPVCRLMDFGKFIFEKRRSDKESKKKQRQMQIKEMKIRPGTDDGDYQVKLRNLIRFLTEGDKAKVTLRFRGREMAHQELGLVMLKRIAADLVEYAQVEQEPNLEGRAMVMVLAPKKKR